MRFLMFCLFFNICSASIIHEKVLICGICRDVETRLPHTINIIEKIGNLFDDYRVVVYENNSKDKTPPILHSWVQKNKRVSAYCDVIKRSDLEKIIVNINADGRFFRPEEIARARNIVLDKVMSDEYKDYPFIIWIDMDFKIPPLLEGIIETFNSGREWDAVFAYGVDPNNCFWDWYALRDNIDPLGPETLGHDWYVPKKLSFKKTDDWYPVYSAFGGCGIYKKTSIKGCRYTAWVTRDLEVVVKKIIENVRLSKHPKILKYLTNNENLKRLVKIERSQVGLPLIKDKDVGIVFDDNPESVIWRMNTFVYQYPSICEHVPFHASMIVRGHDKLFINPRLIFTYGG